MTATDELRRLLDERGVEYKDRNVFGKHVFHWGKPFHRAMFTDAGEWTELVVENASPEQAVEATLGSDLKAENAELRELAILNWEWAHSCCGNSCKVQTEGCGYGIDRECNYEREIWDRMRELGIEVDA